MPSQNQPETEYMAFQSFQVEGCLCRHSDHFDSVVDDTRLFREFVVYEQCQCYPEYLITYE